MLGEKKRLLFLLAESQYPPPPPCHHATMLIFFTETQFSHIIVRLVGKIREGCLKEKKKKSERKNWQVPMS